MRTYKILKKGVFEGTKKFEEKINQMAMEGWKAVGVCNGEGTYLVLLEKEREY